MSSLDAVQFYRMMSNGRTKPMLVGAERSTGEMVDVVAKFPGDGLAKPGLIREAIGAMLASDLGIGTPEPYVVYAGSAFVESLRQSNAVAATRIAEGCGIGYGSAHLTMGFQTWPSSRPLEPEMLPAAAEILAFDCWFQNSDRRHENPNLLFNGTKFAVIDHELAFMYEGVLFWKPPWEHDGVTSMVERHLFGSSLKKTSPSLDRITAALKSIGDERLSAYAEAVPPEWIEDGACLDDTISFVRQVRDNVDAAAQEVLRALK